MIFATTASKIDKVNKNLFRIISVTASDTKEDGVFAMPILLPYASIFLKRKSGELGKKKFIKKYRKYLAIPNSDIENTIFSIGLSLKAKSNICFVCSDDEYKYGYLEELANYIGEVFETEVYTFKDAKEKVSEAIELMDLSKKEKKLLKADKTDLSEKQLKKLVKLVKLVSKDIKSTFGYTGDEYFKSLDHKYAINQIALKLIDTGVATISKEGEFKNIDASKLDKTGPLVRAIITTYESDDELKDVIKDVAKSHDIKIKEKALKKLDDASIIGLVGELYTKLSIYRNNFIERS